MLLDEGWCAFLALDSTLKHLFYVSIIGSQRETTRRFFTINAKRAAGGIQFLTTNFRARKARERHYLNNYYFLATCTVPSSGISRSQDKKYSSNIKNYKITNPKYREKQISAL